MHTNTNMNKDIAIGNWKQMRGLVKEWWGRLTDDEIVQIGGRVDQLTGKLQEKYGYTRQQASDEIHKFLDSVKEKLPQ